MYSKGVSWIDDCRIPHNEDLSIVREEKKLDIQNQGWGFKSVSRDNSGRFPANLLVSDDMLNDGVITKQSQRTYKPTDNSASLFGNSPQSHGMGIGDSGSSSRYYDIDKWFEKLLDV